MQFTRIMISKISNNKSNNNLHFCKVYVDIIYLDLNFILKTQNLKDIYT